MRRRYRILLAAFITTVSISLVLGLSRLGTAMEGPLGASMSSLGSAVGQIEARIALRVRGGGRASNLAWLSPYRVDPAALRAPETILLGAYDNGLPASLEGVMGVEAALRESFPLIHLYTAWGDRPDQRFPARLVQAIRQVGSIPVVTWEPWLTDFENRLHPHIPLRMDRSRGGLAAIAAGTYDFYIDAWAGEAARFGTPLMVRLGHEMNDPYRYPWGPQNNRPEDFVAAWRHVVERFREAGADNVLWVWSPHVAYEGYEWYYPGDDVVDWVATGVLNYGTVARWSEWWSFEEIFGRHYERLAGYGKPLMIAELGTLAVGGDPAAWYDSALSRLPERHPQVRAVLFFHAARDQSVTYQALDWTFTGDPAVTERIVDAVGAW
jgi:hypothetical protein